MRNDMTDEIGETVSEVFYHSELELGEFLTAMAKKDSVVSMTATGFLLRHEGYLVHVYCVNNTFYAKI